jgi:hypothetical protein
MALQATAVRVGVTGKIWFAPQGTAVPAATSGALTGFNEVGYATDAGVTLTINNDTADIRAWQNGDLLRRVQKSVTFSVKFVMAETNEQSLLLYYNNYAHGAAAADGVVTFNSNQPYRGAFVLDIVDSPYLMRVVFPDGQVTDRGDTAITSGDLIGYDTTVAGYPDAAGNAGYMYLATIGAS